MGKKKKKDDKLTKGDVNGTDQSPYISSAKKQKIDLMKMNVKRKNCQFFARKWLRD